MPLPKLHIIIGATRPGRIGPVIATWFHTLAVSHGGFEVELIDLAEVGLPLLDEPENAARGGVYHHDHTKAWSAVISRGDAFVFVVPEYNHGYNAATKNAIDFLYHEWSDKAIGMVSYGGNVGAGTRAVQALKQVFLSLKAFPVHESVSIPFVYTKIDADRRFVPDDHLEQAATLMLDEIARRELALQVLRKQHHPPIPDPAAVGNGAPTTDRTTP